MLLIQRGYCFGAKLLRLDQPCCARPAAEFRILVEPPDGIPQLGGVSRGYQDSGNAVDHDFRQRADPGRHDRHARSHGLYRDEPERFRPEAGNEAYPRVSPRLHDVPVRDMGPHHHTRWPGARGVGAGGADDYQWPAELPARVSVKQPVESLYRAPARLRTGRSHRPAATQVVVLAVAAAPRPAESR